MYVQISKSPKIEEVEALQTLSIGWKISVFVHKEEIKQLMITVERCKNILNKGEYKYNEEEIRLLKEYLYFIGQIQKENNENNN